MMPFSSTVPVSTFLPNAGTCIFASCPTLTEVISVSGTAEEENGTALSFPVSGTVRTLKVHLGQRVVFGQLIATLDPTSMQSSYNAAKAAFKRTEDTYNRMIHWESVF